jgi:hypothetical protein
MPLAGLFGSDQGGVINDKQRQALEQGCVFLRCDQSGGFDCAAGFRCDPTHGPPGNIGCAPIPCTEGAACESDAYVCESTSHGPHLGMDVHGCVARNCDEGSICPASTSCDFTKPGDSRGCAYIRCDEPGGSCAAGKKCHPEPLTLPSGIQALPDSYGCVFQHCSLDGIECPTKLVCAPEDPRGAYSGCAEPPPAAETPTSGAGGSSGSSLSGSSGSEQGGGGVTTAGAAAGAQPDGVCE